MSLIENFGLALLVLKYFRTPFYFKNYCNKLKINDNDTICETIVTT